MSHTGFKSTQVNVECTKEKICSLFTKCINDIEKTLSTSGLTMRDVGFGVEKYMTLRDSYIIEMKMRL